jgi:hypothetical protein
MKTKDFAYLLIISFLVIKLLVSGNKTDIPKPNYDSLNAYKREIELLQKAYELNRKQIDSLTEERNKIKIKYKTKYEIYIIKDSLVNSLSVDSIQRYWSERYKHSNQK